MMKSVAPLFLALTAACSAATPLAVTAEQLPGITLVEKVERHGDELVIPYEKYVLDNGLTVILHVDKSDPLVNVDVTYHVGSSREEVGKSGFAHFFEHMMFQGSENVEDEQHFRIVTASGGSMNGTTDKDRTRYFQTVPNNQLEKTLWLEADRMGFLLPAVTQAKFEIQRDTVKNERAQNVENRPYGLVSEKVSEAVFPEGHPYSWPTIGYVEDLDRVNVNDLKAFFLRWYGPNNATLTIGGDFDRAQTLAWIKKYFGPIARGAEVEPLEKPAVTLEKDRYVSMEDRVQFPLLQIVFPTVHAWHPDEAPLDVLASIMGQGETSLLYKNLVKNGLALQADVGHSCLELFCGFTVSVIPNIGTGRTTEDMEQVIRESFREFEKRGVLDDDIDRVINSLTATMIFGLQSVPNKVTTLALYETFTGNPNNIGKEIQRYRQVTKDDVVRAYEKYINDRSAVFLRVVPVGGQGSLQTPDNWAFSGRTLPEYSEMSEDELALRVSADTFDRSKIPESGPAPEIKVPEYWRGELSNGIQVIGTTNDEAPVTNLTLTLETGTKHDSKDKLGLAALTTSLLNGATTEHSAEELSNQLAKLGSSVSVAPGLDRTALTVASLTQNVDDTLDIAAETLFKPAFSGTDFARNHNQVMQSFRQRKENPAGVAGAVLSLMMWGEDNYFAHPGSGYEETLSTITLEDVKRFYKAHYSPVGANIAVISNLPKEEVLQKLEVFANWEGEALPGAEIKPFPKLDAGTLYLIDRPGAAQSIVRIRKRAPLFNPKKPAGLSFRLGLVNFPLGGAFNSRINLNLREDKGYAYGASSYVSSGEYTGSLGANAEVRADATADSIRELMKEFKNYADKGMTKKELAFMRSAYTQSDALSYETPSQKLGFIAQIQRFDLDVSFVKDQAEVIQTIGLDGLNTLASEYLQTDEMIMLVVGDKAVIGEELADLGYPIVELDDDGAPL